MQIKLIADLGNSESRVMIMGKTGLLAPLNEFFRIDNTYSVVTKEVDVTAYNGTDSKMFIVNDQGQQFKVATGAIGNEFASKLRPTGLEQKYLASTTHLGLARVLIEAIQRVAKHEQVTAAEVLAEATFDLLLLMPPMEVKVAQGHFEQVYGQGVPIQVTYPLELSGLAKVSTIKVLNEGLMGYLAVSLDYATLQPRVLNNDIRMSRVLILDIGAGTTELLLVDKNTMIESSRTTIRKGCINIISKIKALVEAQFGFEVTFEDAERAAKTGILTVGRRQYEVIDSVNEARRDVASALVSSMNSYLSSISIPLSTIEDLLVFGGGVMNEEGTGLNSVAKYIKEPLVSTATGAEFVTYDEYLGKPVSHDVTGDELLFTERTLNIIGAGIVAKIMLMSE